MRKQIIVSILFTIIVLSAQNISAAECQQCIALRKELLASVLEQTKLATQNLEFAQAATTLLNEYDKLQKQYDSLARLNVLLTDTLEDALQKINPKSTQKMNTAECQNHSTQQDIFIASLERERKILAESMKRSKKNVENAFNRKTVTKQSDTAANLNEYEGFYFTDNRHKLICQQAPSQNNSFTS